MLDRLADTRGLPESITVDHGPEFEGQALDARAYERNVTLSFIRLCKPIENAYIKSFNGRFRDECLNEHWFVTMAHARQNQVPNHRMQPTAASVACGSLGAFRASAAANAER